MFLVVHKTRTVLREIHVSKIHVHHKAVEIQNWIAKWASIAIPIHSLAMKIHSIIVGHVISVSGRLKVVSETVFFTAMMSLLPARGIAGHKPVPDVVDMRLVSPKPNLGTAVIVERSSSLKSAHLVWKILVREDLVVSQIFTVMEVISTNVLLIVSI